MLHGKVAVAQEADMRARASKDGLTLRVIAGSNNAWHDPHSAGRILRRRSAPPKDRQSIPLGVTPIFSPQSKLDMIGLYAGLCATGKIVMVSAPFVLHPKILATFTKTPAGTLRFLLADKGSSLGKKGAVQLLEHGNSVSVATTLNTALHDFQGRLLEHEESFHHSGVHIHSKIIAVDPFGPDPVLATGSANFSNNSTLTNDENSLIIRRDTAVMDIYFT